MQDKKLCRFSKEKGYSEFLEDISTSILREWQVHMQEQYVVYQIHVRGGKRQGLAPKTINGRIKTLKHFFNVAIENRLIERNEAAPIKLMKEPIDTVEGLTEDQVKAMLKACMKSKYTGYRDYVFIMLGIDCGLRAGEMITLTARSFDFDIGILKIEEDVSKNQRARIVPRCEVSNEVIAVYEKWKAKEMTAVEAMRKVGMKPNTFYRRVSDLEKERASSL